MTSITLNPRRLFFVMLTLVLAEACAYGFMAGRVGIYLGPWLCFTLSIAVAVVPMVCLSGRVLHVRGPGSLPVWRTVIGWAVFVMAVLFVTRWFRNAVALFADASRWSDIIPAIQVLVSRFLNGEKVYDTIHFSGYDCQPGYLPLKWMPFILSSILNVDPRWLAWCVMILGLVVLQYFMMRRTSFFAELLIKTLVPFFVLAVFIRNQPINFGVTVETLDAAYYGLLCICIFLPSPYLRAFALVLCLLSRFSLVLWVPLYLLCIFFSENKKTAVGIGVLVAAGVLLLYVIPFMVHDWDVFSRGQRYYHHVFVCEWTGSHERYMEGKPSHLYGGIGFAVYILDFVRGGLEPKVALLERIHLLVSALSLVLSGGVYYLLRKSVDYRLLALLALKFYFVFFHLLIPIPYNYLYLVPTMISAFILTMMDYGPFAGCRVKAIEVSQAPGDARELVP